MYEATVHLLPRENDDLSIDAVNALGTTVPIECHSRPTSEDPATLRRYIRRCVNERDVDLLVLDPPRDRGPIPPLADEALQGVIKQVTRPLFLAEKAADPSDLNRILVPTDLSTASADILRHAAVLAESYDASIDLLHVTNRSPYVALTASDRLALGRTPLPELRARRRLQQFVEDHRPDEGSLHIRLAFGEPANQIARMADQEPIDLLVLASHGTKTGAHRPLGEVVDRVLRRVTCPTLLLRSTGPSLLAENASRSPS